MLSTRNLMVAVGVWVALSAAAAALRLAQPPDDNGRGRDTYGIYAGGYRGLVEILEELHIPVKRSFAPPTLAMGQRVTIVFLAPLDRLMGHEPEYLTAVARWVKQGGRLVLAPNRGSGGLGKDSVLLEKLGLTGLKLAMAEFSDPEAPKAQAPVGPQENGTATPLVIFREWLAVSGKERNETVLPIDAGGELAPLGGEVRSVSVPAQGLQVIRPDSDIEPAGELSFKMNERDHIVAAFYRLGQGQVYVMSDPALVANGFISRADNSVLAVNILAGGDRRVVFDEFYHGLTVRGNPVWLLTQRPYGMLFLLLLASTSFWLWRRMVSLGPALEPPSSNRRTMREYLDAMALLFSRSRASQAFMLAEIRQGVLGILCRRFSGRKRNLDALLRAAGRRDQEGAARIAQAFAAADAILTANKPAAGRETLQAARDLVRCL